MERACARAPGSLGMLIPLEQRGGVLGSVGPIPFDGKDKVYLYFIEWDDSLGLPVATCDLKLERIQCRP